MALQNYGSTRKSFSMRTASAPKLRLLGLNCSSKIDQRLTSSPSSHSMSAGTKRTSSIWQTRRSFGSTRTRLSSELSLLTAGSGLLTKGWQPAPFDSLRIARPS